jgi:hypothetical protein
MWVVSFIQSINVSSLLHLVHVRPGIYVASARQYQLYSKFRLVLRTGSRRAISNSSKRFFRKTPVLRDVPPVSLKRSNSSFEGTCCPHLLFLRRRYRNAGCSKTEQLLVKLHQKAGDRFNQFLTLKSRHSEKDLAFYQTARRHTAPQTSQDTCICGLWSPPRMLVNYQRKTVAALAIKAYGWEKTQLHTFLKIGIRWKWLLSPSACCFWQGIRTSCAH